MPSNAPARPRPRKPPAIDWSAVHRLARERFDVRRFRPGQRELIECALTGRDVLGVLPTGAGKSLCYQLPALLLEGAVVVVSPLLALMRDQQEKLAASDIDAAKLDSTLTRSDEREVNSEIRGGEHDLIYVTPERLEQPEQLDLLRTRGVALLVVDEAHCVSQWGHDFRPAYLALRDAVRELGRLPVMALTATATPEVTTDILAQLAIPQAAVVKSGIERPNLFFEVLRTINTAAKQERLAEILAREPGAGIVYTATVRAANELHEFLRSVEPRTGLYHAKLSPRAREAAQARFMAGEDRVIVATKAFGMGIDKPDIRFVVHYQFPDSLESYYQEAGRAGRDGQPARALLLYRLEDRRVQAYFLGGKYPKREESQRLYEALGGEAEVSIAELGERSGLGPRRVRVLAAQLESAGIAERRRGRIRRLREFRDAAELDRFLSVYEERHLDDRERLEWVMRYAEGTLCRMRFLRQYFGEPEGEDCGHCDNCRDRPAERLPAPSPRRRAARRGPSGEAPAFAVGEAVRHRRFGEGQVLEVDGGVIVVAFFRAGTKRVKAGYLQAVAGDAARRGAAEVGEQREAPPAG